MGTKGKTQSRAYKVSWKGPPRIRVIKNKRGTAYEIDSGKLHQGPGTAGRRITYPILAEAVQACHEIRRESASPATVMQVTAVTKAAADQGLTPALDLEVARKTMYGFSTVALDKNRFL